MCPDTEEPEVSVFPDSRERVRNEANLFKRSFQFEMTRVFVAQPSPGEVHVGGGRTPGVVFFHESLGCIVNLTDGCVEDSTGDLIPLPDSSGAGIDEESNCAVLCPLVQV